MATQHNARFYSGEDWLFYINAMLPDGNPWPLTDPELVIAWKLTLENEQGTALASASLAAGQITVLDPGMGLYLARVTPVMQKAITPPLRPGRLYHWFSQVEDSQYTALQAEGQFELLASPF